MNINEILNKKRLICDGGFGTMLQSAGLPAGEAPEKWNITHPDIICDIHKAYIDAGSDIITVNTFGVNTLKYEKSEAQSMIFAAFDCARRAKKECGRQDVLLALDIGPTGRLLEPYGDLDFEDAVNAFSFVAKCGADCGADIVFVETMNDSYETKAAVVAVKENCNIPIFVTNVYDEGAKLMTGADIRAMVSMLEGLGVDALGMNCSLGPGQMKNLLPEMMKYSSTPVMVQPNAGLPRDENGKTVYDIGADEFADIMADIAKMGAAVLGGCCGTTPEYIEKMRRAVDAIPYVPQKPKTETFVSSYTHAVEIGKTPVLIGERINPTGKPKLKEALRTGNMSYLLSEAVSQEEKGIHILDVNVGLPEIDEPSMMASAIKEIQSVTALPLQIDTVNIEAMERAMRVYNGKPLVNSVNGSRQSMDSIFPLVKKYGGAVIALTMDESGIPEDANGRLAIARRIVDEAAKYGIDRKDIIADPLAMTVSSEPGGAQVTLEAIRLIKRELGIKTSLGVSNISFGLPQRDFITSSFYIMALEAGLDCAIMNPYSEEMMKSYFTWRALNRQDDNFGDYIRFATEFVTVEKPSVNPSEKPAKNQTSQTENEDGELRGAIVKGLREKAGSIAKEMLKYTDPMTLINEHIIVALNTVGKGFEEKRIYLPGLLMSAEAAQAAFEEVRLAMPPSSDAESKKIVLATVQGDIHDIGKNIVRVLLENFGFNVIDLGRDVPPEAVYEAAREHKVRLVGLSALMTTTVPSMEKTIKLLHEKLPGILVVVGGAVLTQEYADMIGADKYAADAMETVRYAQSIFG